MKPILALTMGDVNGVGPEILAKVLTRPEVWTVCRPIVFGSAETLRETQGAVKRRPTPVRVNDVAEAQSDAEAVPVFDGGIEAPTRRPGALDAAAGRCAVEWFKLAVRCAMAQSVDGIVTCPLNKTGIHAAGYAYAGHTEILAETTASPDCRMGLFSDTMRIVHVSGHCALRDAIDKISAARVAASIRMGHDALIRLGAPARRIAVAGLNPHAGEDGAFGAEERDDILPAIEQCRREGIDCSGPHPADTVFLRMQAGAFDLTVAMYHDQGHIPLKLIAMDQGVNVTLGIPIVRTSVDHGTAYDIAGKNVARDGSLWAAIRLAAAFAARERK
ncbi:MAG TPA: 4-hydroxythreonine-4-phosphate dehydrogenase PdxA [Candidatus Hydrogenedentes bacterium]|nr:4-hydroxythreonine-4-phosphate dehydrogenase PdxA [Candidatus Hydrogenedentota bacterium]